MHAGISCPFTKGPGTVRVHWTLIAAAFLATNVPVLAQQPSDSAEISMPAAIDVGGKVEFRPALMPKIPSLLPILKLTPQAPPTAFLTETMNKIGIQKAAIQPLKNTPFLAAKGVSEKLMGVVESDRLRAYWHQQTGEAGLFPQLEQLKTEKFAAAKNPHLAVASSLARKVFARPEILPKDATQYTIGDAQPLVGTTAQKGANDQVTVGDTQQYLTYVPARRQVHGYPVHGPGSRALIAIDNAGTIQAFALHWKAGSKSGEARETRNAKQVYEALKAVVQPLTKYGDVQVESVKIVYYDDGGDQLAPAYELMIRESANAATPGQPAEDDSYTVLYAPFGDAALSPTLTRTGEKQAQDPGEDGRNRVDGNTVVPPGDPTVGCYVDRNAQAGFMADAILFTNALVTFGLTGVFTLKQFYMAYPYEFISQASSYVDSVQIALVESHGSWWSFATNFHSESVDLDAIPASGGYGSVNNGKLNYLILHGCNMVPSAEDAPCPAGSPKSDNRPWYHNWFNVFQGLHAAVGFRSEGNYGDKIGTPFGELLSLGVPFISAWMESAMGDSIYQQGKTHKSHCGLQVASGRPSAVSVCGHGDDSVFNQSAIPAATCLVNYWQPN